MSTDDTSTGVGDELAEAVGRAAARFQESWTEMLSAFARTGGGEPGPGAALASLARGPLGQPVDSGEALRNQLELWQGYQELWLRTTARMAGKEAAPVIEPEPDDHRFRAPEWTDHPVFDFVKQSYLLNARWLRRALARTDGLDPDEARKLDFFGRLLVDALSPANFALTNPAVLREIAESRGESLARGMRNLAADIGEGRDGPRHVDMDAFEIGTDIATTPGGVVHQTPLMQLIQYAPATGEVYAKPLLIVPPWINKFYILDLRPGNSFIRWATERGYTVFVVSWVNPDETLADMGFDDYARDGVLAAVDGVQKATGAPRMTAIGYCIGGTLLAAVLAWMAQNGDDRIVAATFFASQADFEDAGDLRVFTGEAEVDRLEPEVRARGYLDGPQMAATFNMLRSNDLIWHFVINNYLLGKDPPVFDLLYWNADSTRFPARLLLDYLRNMYQRNALARKGGFELLGTPLDLGAVGIPTYIQASMGDHIAPAESVFRMTRLFSGARRFLLADAGHIAGVINPPSSGKYRHWTAGRGRARSSFEAWRASAVEHPGSWWPDWHRWLAPKSGPKVAAREPGSADAPVIEAAPGGYVRTRS